MKAILSFLTSALANSHLLHRVFLPVEHIDNKHTIIVYLLYEETIKYSDY